VAKVGELGDEVVGGARVARVELDQRESESCRHRHRLQDPGTSLAFPCRLPLGETAQAQASQAAARAA
jgi:hypothetical protein